VGQLRRGVEEQKGSGSAGTVVFVGENLYIYNRYHVVILFRDSLLSKNSYSHSHSPMGTFSSMPSHPP
jgi:hypothetical protein